MRAAVLHEFNQPLRIEEVTIADPGPGEVLVRLHASGVCRSDLHALEGDSPVVHPPMVLGHEGAGVVAAVGAGVTSVAPGDHVVIGLYGPCGRCNACRSGQLTRCNGPARQSTFGLMADGTSRLRQGDVEVRPFVGAGSLAEYSVVAEPMVVSIADDVSLEAAALTGCGVTTGIGAALNTARVEPGSTVAVIGCGGVGLNVIQGSRLAGASRIVALDMVASKLDLAADLGATDGVLVGQSDPVEAVRALVPGGVDYAFEVIGVPELVRKAFEMTRDGGTAVMVGAPPGGAQVSIDARLLFSDRRLLGCTGGGNIPQRDIPRIIELYRRGRIKLDELIGQRLELDDVDQAFTTMRTGEVARSVVALAG
jgi:S-(hydroxymethyl)glutathione dehydrogenase/alcohol dehydrogenase